MIIWSRPSGKRWTACQPRRRLFRGAGATALGEVEMHLVGPQATERTEVTAGAGPGVTGPQVQSDSSRDHAAHFGPVARDVGLGAKPCGCHPEHPRPPRRPPPRTRPGGPDEPPSVESVTGPTTRPYGTCSREAAAYWPSIIAPPGAAPDRSAQQLEPPWRFGLPP
jgi:hypothetical protein